MQYCLSLSSCLLFSLMMQMLPILAKCLPFRHTAEFNYQKEHRADGFSASAKAADDHALFSLRVLCIFKSPWNIAATWLISSESYTGAFLFLACVHRTLLVIHSCCNIWAFLFHSVLLQISIYAATFISSYFCLWNVSIPALAFWISLLLFWNLII